MKTLGFYCLIFVFLLCACNKPDTGKIDLSGEWRFQMDPEDVGVKEEWFSGELSETINLPGSMAQNDKGIPVSDQTQWVGNLRNKQWSEDENYKPYLTDSEYLFPYWLIADKHYYGAAWYQKDISIPANWDEKEIELVLERCHWETKVWVDNEPVGMQNSLGTAHKYNLSEILTRGKHTITICVDNRIKDVDVGIDSHSISDHTQSNWNGMIGQLKLVKKERVFVSEVQVYPNLKNKTAQVQVKLRNNSGNKKEAKVSVRAFLKGDLNGLKPVTKTITLTDSQSLDIEYPMGEDVLYWDEFNPNLYSIQVEVEAGNVKDVREVQFGMREFKVDGTRFAINGRPVFLRGTLECAIFPKTGYPPTEVSEWKRIINICKAHGLNHIRFHSWCPPEAAFLAADELGFYYQVECSSWANSGSTVGDGSPVDKWLYAESERMMEAYGNHPSFCMLVYGNEPAGKNQKQFLGDFVNYWKAKDNRRVYTSGAGWPAIPESDFHNLPQPRIQGWGEQLKSIINSEAPRSDYDWRDRLQENDRPVVSHEIGQWCVYPNLKEIEKYDGVLKAKNFKIFKKSLEAHHMGHLADSFLLASGKLQALCYKADIEAALRTPGFGGFQLLDLHDFPGQGTALVGVLDPFWEEKGYVTPEEYSRFCNETVPLARFKKRIFTSGEKIEVNIEAAHFGEKEISDVTPSWKITKGNGEILQEGNLETTNLSWGNGIDLGQITTNIKTDKPLQLNLEVELAGFKNDWDFWVYPLSSENKKVQIPVVRRLDKNALDVLNKGGKVLLSVNKGDVKAEKGGSVAVGFSSIFWNTAWTGGQKPHTLGILCNPAHPALNDFPTDYHSNWQWWDAMTNSNAISLEGFTPELKPIVRIIDDWVTNNRLALIFEVKVGKGKLLVSGIDLKNDLDKRPEAAQLLTSLKNYMNTDAFDPQVSVVPEQITDLYN